VGGRGRPGQQQAWVRGCYLFTLKTAPQ
jgi:hypothetical protein